MEDLGGTSRIIEASSRMILDDQGWSGMIKDDQGFSRMIKDDQRWSMIIKNQQGSSKIINDHHQQGSSRIIKDHQGSSSIIKDHHGYSRIFKDIWGYSRVFEDIQGYLRIPQWPPERFLFHNSPPCWTSGIFLKVQRVPALCLFWDFEKIVLHEIRDSGTVLWSNAKIPTCTYISQKPW